MVEGAHAIPNTNMANKTKIRKGNMEQGWKASEVIIEEGFAFNPIRVKQIEDVANDLTKAKDVRVVEMVEALPTQIIDNEAGSSGCREFVLQGMFYDILSKREELQI